MSKEPFVDYAGAIHIHSTCSDGDGSFIEIMEAANEANLDFVVLTDHDTLKLKNRGLENWYKKCFVIIGEEVGRNMGHCIAINIKNNVATNTGDLKQCLKHIEKQNGMSFIVHPEGSHKVIFGLNDPKWRQRDITNFTGIEIWSFMFDWISKVHWLNMIKCLLDPVKILSGPNQKTLKLWDNLQQKQKVIGIGGLDAHNRYLLPFKKMMVFPYKMLFRTIRTHILALPATGSPDIDKNSINSALKDGRCYFSNDYYLDPKGFNMIIYNNNSDIFYMGESANINGGLSLKINVPEKSQIKVFKNGNLLAEQNANMLEMKILEQGSYRCEVYNNDKPWIFSNPIWVNAN